jgi:hypothetical protein
LASRDPCRLAALDADRGELMAERDVSEGPPLASQAWVSPTEIRIESVGVNALDRRRVDVAVDLTPCREPVTVEMVIVGPDDGELCSTLLVDNREPMLDRIMHLRRDAQPGAHTLHVGVFYESELVARAAKQFTFPLAGAE